MKKIIFRIIAVVLILLMTSLMGAMLTWVSAESLSPETIIANVDRNNEFNTAYSESRMEINIGSRKVTKTMRSWSEGNTKALIEFTDKRDQGTRILKVKDDLWLYSPTAESEVKLSGEMMKQGMMGSDFSYNDALEHNKLLDLYQVALIGEENIDSRPCYILELTAKKGAEPSYYRRKSWIDKERFLVLKEELYASSGKLLKVLTVNEVKQFGARYYGTSIIMEDKLRKNSKTLFVTEQIDFDIQIPAETFTRQKLTGKYKG